MKRISPALQAIFKYKITKYLVEEEVVMNWGVLKKCILMLVLGCGIHLSWMLWDIFVLLSPEYWQYVDISVAKMQIILNSLFLLILLCLIYPCYKFRNNTRIERYLPYISVGIFVVSLCRDAYIVGVVSPVAMIAYVSLITVGLVLFSRTLVYSMLIPASIFLSICGYLSYTGQLTYSPLFTIPGKLFYNGFWLVSMLYFILPILAICMMLFEILLSQWRHREKLIQHLSQIDPLTNLFNRRSINQCLDKLNSVKLESYALVLLDLDHFKRINDYYGHHKGDETLIRVSEVLTLLLRESDVVGRFGGEEFILILKNSNLEKARQVAERCRAAIQQLEIYSDDGQRIHVTASFGIALSSPELRPQQLLSQADKALYQAKASGRNLVKAYNATLDGGMQLHHL
ncbi:GGDEF domain-containing protein [Acinetobacter schindleri]|uniref:GGDEF domain-containing protein n=1 Tax=Acinetobacter schindleri TaxID=108981 RepID=UPI0013B0835E|nr:GGDEF domain-containing protein [Acinetobacter schindleri]QIC65434.1 GGDEF domain-containing protein [Acinetobacter schindleri]